VIRRRFSQGGAAGARDKKNRQFLAKPAGTWYCFSESPISPQAHLTDQARPDFGVRTGIDSGMTPQAVETARIGLGDRQAPGRWQGDRSHKSVSKGREAGLKL
jgi:hypothetical protein